jgi:hypothetical protein
MLPIRFNPPNQAISLFWSVTFKVGASPGQDHLPCTRLLDLTKRSRAVRSLAATTPA